MMMRGGGEAPAGAAGAGGPGGQVPTVTVIVPGRSQVARTVTASGTLAARRDQPIGIAGEGGLVTQVYADAGSWVRQGQVLATIDRSVQRQEAAQLAAQINVARAAVSSPRPMSTAGAPRAMPPTRGSKWRRQISAAAVLESAGSTSAPPPRG
jgi:multidrug efflux pump subunit AcrA (membrane-fusion protein)